MATPVFAHGAKLEYQPISGLEIQARYDSGEPMKAAQVNIYTPDNPSEPWQTGTTDDEGRFVFTPDPSQPGNWEVMVRQAGHGDILVIPVTGSGAEASPAVLANRAASRTAGLPLWVSMAAMVWGFVGTALFFARGKR
ncbi:MAG: carboxypeptidase-like regulatory domain-containing protein [Leptolyngbya sp.]|nr:carboxypeptidase-like regulatory domain-containing protein [Leptolyngbya sp.]